MPAKNHPPANRQADKIAESAVLLVPKNLALLVLAMLLCLIKPSSAEMTGQYGDFLWQVQTGRWGYVGWNTLGIYGYVGNDTNITIPEKITISVWNGSEYVDQEKPVTRVSSGEYTAGISTLRGNTSIKSITFPTTATFNRIDSYALNGCTGLERIFIPPNVTTIGSGAFSNCSGLTSVSISGSVVSIEQYAFERCVGLSNVVIPEGVTSLGMLAFGDCTGLKSVTLPASITSMGYYTGGGGYRPGGAFDGCSNLESVIIGRGADIGTLAFFNCQKLATVTYVGTSNPDNSSNIGSNAFGGCLNLTNINLPEGLASIGQSAFSGCVKLTNVTIPASVTSWTGAFISCTGLTNVTLSEGLTSIGDQAFHMCTNLTNVFMAEGLKSVGTMAFYQCSNLADVVIPNSVTSIGDYAFHGCTSLNSLTLPSGATSTGNFTFLGCTGLTSVTIPTNLTRIGDGAFYNCSALANVIATIPSGVTSIGDYAFYGCSGLASIGIPASVTTIGERAFEQCAGLTSMIIPEGVTTLGSRTFSNCNSLVSAEIPSSLANLSDYTFENCYNLTTVTLRHDLTRIGDHAFNGCLKLGSIFIPDSVTTIGSYAFSSCSGLTNLIIPESVTSIGAGAFNSCSGLTSISIPPAIPYCDFNSCSNLTSIIIPSSVTSIGDYALAGCTSLTSINIPNSVTRIGTMAFGSCYKLTSLTIPDSVTSIGDYAFSGCSGLTCMVFNGRAPTVGSNVFYYLPSGFTIYYLSTYKDTGFTSPTWQGMPAFIAAPYGGIIPDVPVNEAHLIGGLVTEGNVKLEAQVTRAPLVWQRQTTPVTIDMEAARLLRLGATGTVRMETGGGALTIGKSAGDGFLTAGGAANTAGTLVLDDASANDLTINAVIADNGSGVVSLVKNGNGKAICNASNSYTGSTTVTGGTLVLNSTCLADNSNLLIASGAIIELDHIGSDVVGALYLGGTKQADGIYHAVNSGGFITGTGSIQVGFSVTRVIAAGAWSEAGNWSAGVANGATFTADFSGINLAADRTMHLDSPRTVGNLVFGDTDIGSAGSWTLDNNGNAANILTLDSTMPTLTVNPMGSGKAVTISAEMAGSHGLTKAGVGTLILSAAQSYSGPTVISDGTLMLGTTNALPTTTAVTLSNATGAWLDLNGHNQTIGSLAGGAASGGNVALGGGLLTVGDSTSTTYAGVISGTGGLTKQGTGTLTLSAVQSYSGPTVINGGTLKVAAPTEFVGTDGNTVTATANAAESYAMPFKMVDGSAMSDNPVVRTSQNTNNWWTGSWLTHVSSNPYYNTGWVLFTFEQNTSLNEMVIWNLLSTETNANAAYGRGMKTVAITYSIGTDTSGVGGGTIFSGDLKQATWATGWGYTDDFTFPQVLNVKAVRIAYTSNYGGDGSGLSEVLFGTGRSNHNISILPATTALNLTDSGATLDLDGAAQTLGSLTGVPGSKIINIGDLNIVGDNASTAFDGEISGSGSLTKTGTGSLLLSGSNTYTGDTTVHQGTLSITQPNFSDISTITVASGAVLDLPNTGTDVVGALDLAGTLQADGVYDASNTGRRITGAGSIRVSSVRRVIADADGIWSEADKWEPGIAGGASATADFSTIDITADRVMHLDTPRSIGHLIFGDTNVGSPGSWTIDNHRNAANILTLAGTTPTITVNALAAGKTATIQAAIAGTSGFTKLGTGTLTLRAALNYSGPTVISGGTLKLISVSGSPVAGTSRWFDASKLGHANGQAVTLWNDGSGNGANASVPAGNFAPTYLVDAGTGSGLGAMQFNAGTSAGGGADNSQSLVFPRDSSIRSVCAVFKGASFLLTDSGSTYDFHRPGDSNPADPLWSQWTSTYIASGRTYVNGVQVNGYSYNMPTDERNGYNIVSVVASGAVTADGFNKDRGCHSGTQSQAEVLIYDFELTDTQRQQNEDYLYNKWFGLGGGGPILPSDTAVNLTTSDSTLDLANAVQTIGSLSGVAGSRIITSATLSIGNDNSNTTFAGEITGAGSLTKTGTGSLVLAGDNTYTGDTCVSGGILVLKSACLADNSTVTVVSGAVLNLDHTRTEIIGALYLGGTKQANGVYNATNSGGLITGTGSIQVGEVTGFAAWVAANAPGQATDQDHDHDGVANGVEYFMGKSGNDFTANPSMAADGTVAWPKSPAFSGSYAVQTSSDLVEWTDVTDDPAQVTKNSDSVVWMRPTGPGSRFVRLLVTPN